MNAFMNRFEHQSKKQIGTLFNDKLFNIVFDKCQPYKRLRIMDRKEESNAQQIAAIVQQIAIIASSETEEPKTFFSTGI